jgi:hypothetical protein
VIQLFKSNNPITIFFVLAAAVLLRLPYFMHPTVHPFHPTDLVGSFVFEKLIGLISSNALLYNIIALVLVVSQALLWNSMLNNLRFLPSQNFLPSLVYVTFTAVLPDFIGISQSMLVAFAVLWMLNKVVNIYKKEKLTTSTFDLGFTVGICSLLGSHFITIGLFLILALLILRPMQVSEWFNFITGLFIPFFLVGTWSYYNGFYLEFQQSFFENLKFSIHHQTIYNLSFWMVTGVTLFSIGVNYFLLNSRQLSRLVLIRKFFNVLFHLSWIIATSWFISSDKSFAQFYILAIPMSFYFAYYLCIEKKNWKADLFYLFWVSAILGSQYFLKFS